MKPIAFKEATHVLPAPPGQDNIAQIQVNVAGHTVTSCWRMSWRERWHALRYGLVWVRVIEPKGVPPPMAIDARESVFDKQK